MEQKRQKHKKNEKNLKKNTQKLRKDGKIRILTKGDNNTVDDAYGIYARGQMWLERKDIMGKAIGYVPQAGFLTIWINESQYVKVLVIGAMCLYVLFTDEGAHG